MSDMHLCLLPSLLHGARCALTCQIPKVHRIAGTGHCQTAHLAAKSTTQSTE
jgi:hypothetical protein